MDFRTPVTIEKPDFEIEPEDDLLFLGSCFANNIGQRFKEMRLRATVNPRGTMYNPASILHTLQRCEDLKPRVAFLTLGTNHVYRLKETGEIVDNCEKRPARLFQEEELSVGECADYLRQCADLLRQRREDVRIVFTVSPIRYRKYGYHGSQISKATLLLAVDQVVKAHRQAAANNGQPTPCNDPSSTVKSPLTYFPAYELVLDELRDYRFYQPDMLHPSDQAVGYLYERLSEFYFSPRLKEFLRQWEPVRAALQHRPFNADSPDHQAFVAKTQQKLDELRKDYPFLDL